jgi:outer membrane lipoprotein SlyB
MARLTIDKIPPGPKLDALTAEKVFGWQNVRQHKTPRNLRLSSRYELFFGGGSLTGCSSVGGSSIGGLDSSSSGGGSGGSFSSVILPSDTTLLVLRLADD